MIILVGPVSAHGKIVDLFPVSKTEGGGWGIRHDSSLFGGVCQTLRIANRPRCQREVPVDYETPISSYHVLLGVVLSPKSGFLRAPLRVVRWIEKESGAGSHKSKPEAADIPTRRLFSTAFRGFIIVAATR